jgi:hypothetical protein
MMLCYVTVERWSCCCCQCYWWLVLHLLLLKFCLFASQRRSSWCNGTSLSPTPLFWR